MIIATVPGHHSQPRRKSLAVAAQGHVCTLLGSHVSVMHGDGMRFHGPTQWR